MNAQARVEKAGGGAYLPAFSPNLIILLLQTHPISGRKLPRVCVVAHRLSFLSRVTYTGSILL